MPVAFSLREVVETMDILSSQHVAYINLKTGELVILSEEEMSLVEDEAPPENLPEWQQEMLLQAQEVLKSDDFIALPDKFEINEWSIMKSFCHSLEESDQKTRLLDAIHRRGAFRRFKAMLYQMDMMDN